MTKLVRGLFLASKEFTMNTKFSRMITMVVAAMMAVCVLLSLSACNGTGSQNETASSTAPTTSANVIYDKYGNPVQMPTDNDIEGWFSVEVLNEYNAAGFILPKGTEVSHKTERTTLYLKGNEKALETTVLYAFEAIYPTSDGVYLPVLTKGDDGVAKVTSLKRISTFETDNLSPKGDDTSVTFIYTTSHRVLECAISLVVTPDSNGEPLVEVSFTNRTEQYGDLV